MSEEMTCGQGLAQHSAIEAKLAELIAAVADNLEAHLKSLDTHDQEHEAYVRLAHQHRAAATQLQATAREMESDRDLPMGKHDPAAMADASVMDAFTNYVNVKQELIEVLQKTLEQDRAMLGTASS